MRPDLRRLRREVIAGRDAGETLLDYIAELEEAITVLREDKDKLAARIEELENREEP